MKKKTRFSGVKGTIILIILVGLIVSYFYYLSNKKPVSVDDEGVVITPAEEILLKNYNINYPPTPKEVVREYLQITKVLHNEELSDEEISDVGMKVQQLYDEEFVANKSTDEYIMDLKSEIANFKTNEYSIANYYTSSSTDVVYGKVNGYDCAKLYANYTIRAAGRSTMLQEVFILRKDAAGHWKIYGWQPVDDENENEDKGNE